MCVCCVWGVCADSVFFLFFDKLIIASKGWRNIVLIWAFYFYLFLELWFLFANIFARLTVSVKSSRFVTANFSHGRLRVRDTCEWSDDAIQIQIPGCSVSQTRATSTSRARRQRQKACSVNFTHTSAMYRRAHSLTHTHTCTHAQSREQNVDGSVVGSRQSFTHKRSVRFLFVLFCHSQWQQQQQRVLHWY